MATLLLYGLSLGENSLPHPLIFQDYALILTHCSAGRQACAIQVNSLRYAQNCTIRGRKALPFS